MKLPVTRTSDDCLPRELRTVEKEEQTDRDVGNPLECNRSLIARRKQRRSSYHRYQCEGEIVR
ncbi:hypothetical protein PPUN110474_27550 [Pseudomonas putida]|nr:hypothetical protein PPUN110474_27550 [Pseudomonas putida]